MKRTVGHLNKQFLFVFSILCVIATSARGFSLPDWNAITTGRPLITIGAGTATTSDIGVSKSFPIINPFTDEFYYYSAKHSTQTSGLGDVFVGAEWPLQPNWLIQGGLDYNQATPYLSKGNLLQGADAQSADSYFYYYHILNRQLLLEGKLLYIYRQYFYPYLQAGFGATFNKSYNYYTNIPPFLTFTRMYEDHSNTAFSYAIGIGIDADIASNMRLGVSYHFSGLGRTQLGRAEIDGSNVAGTFSQGSFNTNNVLVELTWLAC